MRFVILDDIFQRLHLAFAEFGDEVLYISFLDLVDCGGFISTFASCQCRSRLEMHGPHMRSRRKHSFRHI